jgi:hypothetical protein
MATQDYTDKGAEITPRARTLTSAVESVDDNVSTEFPDRTHLPN